MSMTAVAVIAPVFAIARSASRWTIVFAAAMLFVGLFASGCRAVTTAVFVIVPCVAGSMSAQILTLSLPAALPIPTLHITTFGAVWVQPEDAPANVVAAGSVSVTVPPLEVDGPLFVTMTA